MKSAAIAKSRLYAVLSGDRLQTMDRLDPSRLRWNQHRGMWDVVSVDPRLLVIQTNGGRFLWMVRTTRRPGGLA